MRKKATNSDNDNNIKTTIITKIYNWMHYLRVEIQWRKKGDRQTMLNQEEQQKYL